MRAISRELLHLRPKLRDLMRIANTCFIETRNCTLQSAHLGILTTFPFERDRASRN